MIWPKAFALLAMTATLASCTSYIDKCKPFLEKDVKEKKTFSFHDVDSSAHIKLRTTNAYFYEYYDTVNVEISYIISMSKPLSNTSSRVFLSLKDSDGFEIKRFFTSAVVKDFTGLLKGSITVSPQEYQKIAGAELFLTVDAN